MNEVNKKKNEEFQKRAKELQKRKEEKMKALNSIKEPVNEPVIHSAKAKHKKNPSINKEKA